VRGTANLACGRVDGEKCPACEIITQPVWVPTKGGYGGHLSSAREGLEAHWETCHDTTTQEESPDP
jgi:hypothetical protein